jgi:colanic acid/amylovoran biosynthesis glycosyltransferase
MTVAYLVNQYPHVSHSFIRREIAALEAQGVAVARFSVRPAPDDLVDPADLAERGRTTVLLAAGAAGLLLAAARALVTSPVRFVRALGLTVRLGHRSDRGVLRHLAYLAEACLLLRRLRAAGADHLHAHFGTNPAAVALLTRILGGPPYSFTVHGPEEFDRPEALSLGAKIEHAAFVVAVSDFGRGQLFRWCGHAHWPKVRVVHCGLDGSFLGREPTPVPAAPRLVCIGRLCAQKGQLLLLDAAARLAKEGVDFTLVLAGDGPMRPDVDAAIRRHGFEAQVRVTGWLRNAAVRDEIRAARALVLPSLAEGLPVVLMESLALGRPVVATAVAGVPELVRPGENGWLIPAGSVQELTAALRAVLREGPERLTALGRAGAARVAERHDASREAAELAALFRLSRGSGSADRLCC